MKDEMKDSCPPIVFAGSRYELFIKEHRNDDVIFLGSVDGQLLVYLYKNAPAVVYSSLYECIWPFDH